MMQRRLSQISQIPLIIQTALESVTRAFEEFMPDEHEMNVVDDIDDDAMAVDANGDENQGNTTEGDNNDDDMLLNEYDCYDYDGDDVADGLQMEGDAEVIPTEVVDPNVAILEAEKQRELAEQEEIKAQKLEKITKIERGWPWKDVEKKIHK